MRTPSNKVMYFFIFVVAVVTLIISYNAYQAKKPRPLEVAVEPLKDLAIVVENQYSSADTDGDGLLDWEEALWNTNASAADTDKDGTSDGAEVALSRDPNTAGPNDTWNPNSYLDEYVSGIAIDTNSLTSRIARNLLVAVGQTDSPNIAQDLLAQIQSEIKRTTPVKQENLITFDSTDKEKMQIYANQLLSIYQEETTLVMISNPSDTNLIITAYKNMASRLTAIPVPRDIGAAHTSFINNMINMAIFTDIIARAESDPIKMVAVIPELDKLINEQGVLLGQITGYLKSNGIILQSNA